MSRARFHGSRLRASRYDTLVFSPHLDDAVYSLGGSLLAEREAGRSVLVVTVFGHGRPEAPVGEGPYDDYATRQDEDRRAMEALDVDYLWLNRPELLFRRKGWHELMPHATYVGTSAARELGEEIERVVAEFAQPGARLFLPLAVGAHPDHRLLHEAGRLALLARSPRYYEDVPYSLEPALLEARIAGLRGTPGPGAWRLARATARLAFRGPARVLALPVLVALFAMAEWLRRVRAPVRAELRLAERIDIAESLVRKAEAMRLYRSQTPLFFDPPSRVEAVLLHSTEGAVERAWTIV